MSALETEVTHLQSSVTTHEGLLTEYRSKPCSLRNHIEKMKLSKELRKTEQQMEHCRQEYALEANMCRSKLQQQLSDMESMPELLKVKRSV